MLIKGDNDYLYLLGHLENFNDAHGKQHKVGDLVSLGEVPVKVGGGRSWEDNSKAAGGRWHSTIMEESLRDREGSSGASKSLSTKPFHAVPNGRMQVRGRPEDSPRHAGDREICGRKLFWGIHCQPRHP